MSQVKLGDKNIPFIYQGTEVLYPNPVKDGLVLYYDFKGMTNGNIHKEIAEDLSGNGLSASLYNSAYNTEGSGYIDGLHFDGIDDSLGISHNPLEYQGKDKQEWTVSFVLTIKDVYVTNLLLRGINKGLEIRKLGDGNKVFNFLSNNSKLYLYSKNILPLNEKCHITYSYNYVEKKNRIFINGVLDSELIVDDSIDQPEGMLSTLQISSQRNNAIHSLQIYNRALSEEEVQHNYQLEKERWGL